MADISDSISLIEGKISRVVQYAEKIIFDNEHLKRQVEDLYSQLDEKNNEVKALESKYQGLKLTKTMASSPDDVKDVKQQINKMIREIDKCIALLNR